LLDPSPVYQSSESLSRKTNPVKMSEILYEHEVDLIYCCLIFFWNRMLPLSFLSNLSLSPKSWNFPTFISICFWKCLLI